VQHTRFRLQYIIWERLVIFYPLYWCWCPVSRLRGALCRVPRVRQIRQHRVIHITICIHI